MGRFDLAFNPETGDVKMLEYNADTPTLVIETRSCSGSGSKIASRRPTSSIRCIEKLIARYAEIGKVLPRGEPLFFSSLRDYPEEVQHVRYFQDLAHQAGLATASCAIEDIGWNAEAGEYRDLLRAPGPVSGRLSTRGSGSRPTNSARTCSTIASAAWSRLWKMILSNKALLPIPWRLFPHHPNLLPASFREG